MRAARIILASLISVVLLTIGIACLISEPIEVNFNVPMYLTIKFVALATTIIAGKALLIIFDVLQATKS